VKLAATSLTWRSFLCFLLSFWSKSNFSFLGIGEELNVFRKSFILVLYSTKGAKNGLLQFVIIWLYIRVFCTIFTPKSLTNGSEPAIILITQLALSFCFPGPSVHISSANVEWVTENSILYSHDRITNNLILYS